jgi:N-terminal domain of galactosyltransferase/N-terminal region of glycosyl transferase group 7
MAEQKGLILTTLRDRDTHWRVFRMYMHEFYSHLTVAVIQQADTRTWNKGLLYNTGYHLLAKDYDYIILHDIDWLPVVGKVDYSPTEVPCMIGGEASQFNYQLQFPTFFGGVVVCSKEHYELINGFSNRYRGYGGEDCDLRNSFVQKGIQPIYKMGRFECFAHPKPDITIGSDFWKSADYQNNWKLVHEPRDFFEGLSTCMDMIESIQTDMTHNYIHIKAKTK